MLALRTQQVIAHESGVTAFVDPLGGSYFVERLTRDMEDGARDYFQRIDDQGGMVAAIEQGYPQREIAESAYRFHQEVENGERTIVGVNRFTDETDTRVETLYLDEGTSEAQCARIPSTASWAGSPRPSMTQDTVTPAVRSDNCAPAAIPQSTSRSPRAQRCPASAASTPARLSRTPPISSVSPSITRAVPEISC